MGMFSFGHKPRDPRDPHPRRCVVCGAPLRDPRASRCGPCEQFGGPGYPLDHPDIDPLDLDLDMDAPLDEADGADATAEYPYPELPPLSTLPALRTPEEQRRYLDDATLRHTIQRACAEERRRWIAHWLDQWAILAALPEPVGFALDLRCSVCCDIANEQMATFLRRPSVLGFRCPTHRPGPRATRREEVAQ